MSTADSNYLIQQLLRSQLTRTELDEFLAGLHDEDDVRVYSEVLEAFFIELLKQHKQQPEPDPQAD
ncbi:hypothetical protein [Spirosoma fluviale]|uniref:Uncharacterized protein n=1 Tax=Spirosoma fluviale TaxID=1597977 RepID=A0A286GBR2_9BACT|nr:hypothetical protein [Spirosoma fluviale]SOD92569.1 hypothetical protein SAMN06269250_4045 [Spirosoma fluviale]